MDPMWYWIVGIAILAAATVWPELFALACLGVALYAGAQHMIEKGKK